MDPNFPKLYKMAQLTIEYLLVRRRPICPLISLSLSSALSRSNQWAIGRLRTDEKQRNISELFLLLDEGERSENVCFRNRMTSIDRSPS